MKLPFADTWLNDKTFELLQMAAPGLRRVESVHDEFNELDEEYKKLQVKLSQENLLCKGHIC